MALWQRGTTVYDDSSGQMMPVMSAPEGTYPEPQFSFVPGTAEPSVSPSVPGGGGVVAPAPSYTDDLISLLTQQVVPKALEFDVEAARRLAEQEWGPYYDELLEDYVSELERQSGKAQETLAGRFEDRGLYYSGQRLEEQKQAQEEADRLRRERERNIARQKEAAITGQVEQLRTEQYGGYY